MSQNRKRAEATSGKSVRLSEEVWRRAKLRAVSEGKTLGELVEAALEQHLEWLSATGVSDRMLTAEGRAEVMGSGPGREVSKRESTSVREVNEATREALEQARGSDVGPVLVTRNADGSETSEVVPGTRHPITPRGSGVGDPQAPIVPPLVYPSDGGVENVIRSPGRVYRPGQSFVVGKKPSVVAPAASATEPPTGDEGQKSASVPPSVGAIPALPKCGTCGHSSAVHVKGRCQPAGANCRCRGFVEPSGDPTLTEEMY